MIRQIRVPDKIIAPNGRTVLHAANCAWQLLRLRLQEGRLSSCTNLTGNYYANVPTTVYPLVRINPTRLIRGNISLRSSFDNRGMMYFSKTVIFPLSSKYLKILGKS